MNPMKAVGGIRILGASFKMTEGRPLAKRNQARTIANSVRANLLNGVGKTLTELALIHPGFQRAGEYGVLCLQ